MAEAGIENKAFGYVRASTAKQERDKTYRYQENEIRDYAKSRNLEILNVYQDLGISGIETDRNGFNELIANIDKVKHVIFFDWSRISRNMLFSSYLLYEFNNMNVTLHDVFKKDVIKLDDDATVLMQQIESFVASQERFKIKARQSAGIKVFIQEHGYWGRADRKLNKKEIDQYLKLREAKVSKSAIARVLHISKTILYRNLKELGIEKNLRKLKVNELKKTKKSEQV